MTTLRPGLAAATGHAQIITAVPVTVNDVVSIVSTQSTATKQEVIDELTITVPTLISVVTSFNGLTGAVSGVSSFNGSTGSVSFVVDGGEY